MKGSFVPIGARIDKGTVANEGLSGTGIRGEVQGLHSGRAGFPNSVMRLVEQAWERGQGTGMCRIVTIMRGIVAFHRGLLHVFLTQRSVSAWPASSST